MDLVHLLSRHEGMDHSDMDMGGSANSSAASADSEMSMGGMSACKSEFHLCISCSCLYPCNTLSLGFSQ